MVRCLLLALMFCSLFSGISAGWGADEWSGWSSKGKGYGSYGRSSSYAGGKGWGKGKSYSSSSFSFERGFLAGQQMMTQSLGSEEDAAGQKSRRRRNRGKAAEDSSNTATPETTPEKQKPKVSKLKEELKELRSYRDRMEKAQAEEEQANQLKAMEARFMEAIAQAQKSSSATSSHKGPDHASNEGLVLTGVQRKLAARMFREYEADFEPETWEHVSEFVEGMSGKHSADYLKTAQVAVPKTLKDRTAAILKHAAEELDIHPDKP